MLIVAGQNGSRKAPAAQELCEQTKNEMEAARRLHEETKLGLMTSSNITWEQLEESQLELKKARVKV